MSDVKKASRLQGLDALRGIAAILVVLHHYTFRYFELVHDHSSGLLVTLADGHFGVNLFFIISGFVIFMSLERSRRLADFLVMRFARLWPAYLTCAAITSTLIVATHFNPLGLTVRDALLNVLMMNKLLGNVTIDGSYWTLTYEVLFYAGVALVFFGVRIRRMEWACLAWLAVAVVARVSGFNDSHDRFGVLLGVDFCHFFVLGMMIYLAWQRRATWLTGLTSLLAFSMTLFGPYYNPGDMGLWPFVLLMGVFALSVWFVVEKQPRLMNVWPLVFLGEISYSLYLVHQIAGYWLISILRGWGWNANLAVLATILAAVLVATCVRKTVEVPMQRLIRALYQKKPRPYLGAPHVTPAPGLRRPAA